MKVLVAYATCHGSTRSVAERVATRLTENGHEVDILECGQAHDVWRYDAVVAGSAIHNGDWLPEGAEFLHRHAGFLAERPLWLFSVGMAPAGKGRRGRWLATHTPVPRAVEVDSGYLAPRDLRSFAGVLERSHLPSRIRPFMWALGARFGDFRDWPQIDAWAFGIADDLASDV